MTPIRCGSISHVVANAAFCFCAILKYEFWKAEGEIGFLKQMCFSACGDGTFIFYFHVSESLKRNERRKEKVRMKRNCFRLSDMNQISHISKFRLVTWPWSDIGKHHLPRGKVVRHCFPPTFYFLKI